MDKESRRAFKDIEKVLYGAQKEFFKDKPEPKTEKEAEQHIKAFNKWLKRQDPKELKEKYKSIELPALPKKDGKSLWVEQIDDHEWSFGFVCDEEYEDLFEDALEHMDNGEYGRAQALLIEVIDKVPEYIDAHHHLAIVLDNKGNYKRAKRMWRRAVQIGMDCFPKEFSFERDKLEWSTLENRPFLRAYVSLGLRFLEENNMQEALTIFENVLHVNPDDNQGCRELATECYFALGNPEGILSICRRYVDDAMPSTLYGKVLALFQLGDVDKARKALKEAIKLSPLVAKELAKDFHQRPRSSSEYGIVIGSPEEAYEYFISFGAFWKATKGAVDFIREHLP